MFDDASYKTDFQKNMEELTRKREQKRLAQLRQQYSVTPDFGNMNLQEELNARYDIGELNQLQQKYGEQSQPIPQTASVLTQASTPVTLNNSLSFDGEKLDWIEDGQVIRSWPAMSGKQGYQCREYTNVTNRGPIPEGTWSVKQSQLQNFDDLPLWKRIIANNIDTNMNWSGGWDSWGNHRIWINPLDGTDNLNRTRLSIHGGKKFGSAGCVDLAGGMDDFTDQFKKYGQDMRLTVKYPKKCW